MAVCRGASLPAVVRALTDGLPSPGCLDKEAEHLPLAELLGRAARLGPGAHRAREGRRRRAALVPQQEAGGRGWARFLAAAVTP